MHIGIFPELNPQAGGVHQYSMTLLHAIESIKDIQNNFSLIIENDSLLDKNKLNEKWNIISLHKQPLHKKVGKYILNKFQLKNIAVKSVEMTKKKVSTVKPSPTSVNSKKNIKKWLQKNGIQMMYYPTSNSLSYEINIPYVFTVHDLQHRLQPEFPEVSEKGEWERRENNMIKGISNATLIVAESEVGKEDIGRYYGKHINSMQKIKVLPYLPAFHTESVSIYPKKMDILPEKYLFYPAQFWPHKNHVRIIVALGLIKEKYGLNVNLVLTGSNEGELKQKTYNAMLNKAKSLKINENIIYLGYVNENEISYLYKHAVALIMPTFFGPTNIPFLEAWKSSCPVITSNIRGIREQVGVASILVNPRSPNSIAQGILKVWKNKKIREKLIQQGKKNIDLYSEEDYNQRLMLIINEAKKRIN